MKALFVALLVALGGTLAGCEDAATVTLRVTMEVEADGTPYSSSTVINLRYSTGYTFLKYGGYTSTINFGHHAPYVRIGENGALFLPLKGGQSPQLGLEDFLSSIFALSQDDHGRSMWAYTRPIFRVRAPVTLPLDHRSISRLRFIYFPDRLAPTSARRKSLDELKFDGIVIKNISVEPVDSRPTNAITSVLPWIEPSKLDRPIYVRDPSTTLRNAGDNLINIYTYNLVGKL